MKKFDPKRIIGYLIITLFAFNGNLYSQSSSFGNTYIFNNGEMAVVDIQHNFLNGGSGIQPGTVGTDRIVTQGFMSFVGTASWTGASDAMHVDGYAKSYMTTAFTFPIGDNGKYRPAAISTASLANPANAAYYGVSATTAITTRLSGGNEPVLPASGPFNTTLMGAGVLSVDNLEYWDINGATPAKITLTWDVTSAITSLSSLGILGWDGSQWVAIVSTIDSTSIFGNSSSLSSGSITTNAILVPNTYEIYTLGTVCGSGVAPTLSSFTIANICPSTTIDLNSSVTSPIPSGSSLIWFTNSTHTGSAYATPSSASAGTYYAFYYDSLNSCYTPGTTAVTATIASYPDTPIVASTIQTSCIIETGTIELITQSGVEYSVNNGTTYQSSPTFTGLIPGTYTLKIRSTTSITCFATGESTVTILAIPSTPILSSINLINVCPETTVNLNSIVTSSVPFGTTLVWFTNNSHTGIAYATATAAIEGTYYAYYFDSVNNCYTPASAAVTTNLDSDCDGIGDIVDIDDDNDGILDAVEAPSCYYTAAESKVITSVTSQLASYSTYILTNSYDNNASTSSGFVASQNWVGQDIFNITPTNPLPITGLELDLVNWALSSTATDTFKLQGYNGTIWTDLSLVVSSTATTGTFTITNTLQPNVSYKKYRIIGVAGACYYSGVKELRLVPSSYQGSSYPKPTCSVNTDGDGITNDKDLDSDGDGCSDAKEASATNSITANYTFAGPYGANGLANSLETVADNGIINYNSTYQYAISNVLNACTDTDGDGIGDLVDIDDDNDGILDVVECPLPVNNRLNNFKIGIWGSYPIGTTNMGAQVTNPVNYGPSGTTVTGSISFEDVTSDLANMNAAQLFAKYPIINMSTSDPSAAEAQKIYDYVNLGGVLWHSYDLAMGTVLFQKFGGTGTVGTINAPTTYETNTNSINNGVFGDVRSLSGFSNTYPSGIIYANQLPATAKIFSNCSAYSSIAGFTMGDKGTTLGRVIFVFDELQYLASPGGTISSNMDKFLNNLLDYAIDVSNIRVTATVTCDTDGDGIINSLDLDSDGDGCPDAKESAVPGTLLSGSVFNTSGTTSVSNAIAQGPYGANGLSNSLEFNDTSSSTTNYISTYSNYALINSFNACTDTDGDGIADLVDIDDDNDGILDAVEAPSCYYSASEISIPKTISSDLIIGTGSLTSLSDNNATTTQNFTAQDIVGKSIYEVTPASAIAISTLNLNDATTIFVASNKVKLQGWTGSTWVDLSVAVTPPAVVSGVITFTNTINPTVTYPKYRLFGDATSTGNINTNVISEITLTPTAYQASKNPKATCTVDTDGDGITNDKDLDSDGDGCSDAKEASATSSSTANYAFAGPYGANGLADSLETATESGVINYISSYQYAMSSTLNGCTDTDGDGIGDLVDIDDDNDGTLDAVEAPSCYYTAAESKVITSVTSQLASYSTYILTNSYDNNASTSSGFVASQNWVGQDIFNITPTNPLPITGLELDLVNWALSSTATDTFKLQGYNGTIWTDLSLVVSSTATTGTFTITNTLQPNVSYKKYRIIGVAGACYYSGVKELRLVPSSYQGSSYPKPTCSVNTDGDGITNDKDLDSDGDGCSDAKEGNA
ncbi:beta strand repeat-containing protein, partial [Flavobacterium sp.]|uniref:beta strand repeat-containing protein n=1 Tax=Flavobacterium sp. TaxID=239 RepID=UPI003BD90713